MIEGAAHRIFNPLGIEAAAGVGSVPGRAKAAHGKCLRRLLAQRRNIRFHGDVCAGICRAAHRQRQIDLTFHQLKTPLANLSLYTEILETGELAPEKKAEFADKMQRQIEKLNWIVESLSKMVKLEQNIDEFEVQDTKIKQTILDAVDAVYAKLEKKGIRLEMEEFDDRLLYHNRKWTVEVFVNLLENAIKYTEPGGAIRIQVRPYELYTEIQIADTGRGIRQEELTDIFKRFYRSPEVENMEGSGIGLYLSNLILEKEKGYITAVSEYGKGSCFSVFLQNCKNESSVL